MKINDSIKKNLGLGLDKTSVEKTNDNKNAEKAATTASANVTVSSASVKLQSVASSNAAGEVFDADKVAAIKKAISEGDFKVDAEKVADGLIQTVRDLIQPKH